VVLPPDDQSPGVYFDSSLGGSRLEERTGCVAWDMLRLPWSGVPAELGGSMFSGGEEDCWCIVKSILI
jgi:hypothetical protein